MGYQAVHCSCDDIFNANDVGRHRGLLWARHAHADIADVLPRTGSWHGGEAGGSEAVYAARRAAFAATSAGSGVAKAVARRRGQHRVEAALADGTGGVVDGLDRLILASLATETKLFGIGDDRSEMEVMRVATEKEDSPPARIGAMMAQRWWVRRQLGLLLRRRDVVVVVVVVVVDWRRHGWNDGQRARQVAASDGIRRQLSADGGAPWLPPPCEEGGAP
ncbi:hypothetical protein ACLOJK_022321 [Asimina triloba]